MRYRIITHGGCTSMDGFASAFIFKKYLAPLLGIEISEIRGVNPVDVELGTFKFSKGDIVLDLPMPKEKIFFWCDHHLSAKPKGDVPENYYWKEVPSCTGYLIDIAVEMGLKPGKELLEFKEALDIMDGALYSKEQIKKVYYPRKSYEDLSMLEKVHVISAMFHTGDYFLNLEVFQTLLSDLSTTPVDGAVWKLQPLMYFKAMLKGYEAWRKDVDEIMYLDPESKCVVVDQRKKFLNGRKDRFYPHMKFPESAYNLFLKSVGVESYLGIGSNIFHKDRCKVNLGELCKTVGVKFGKGSGGGHYAVGGATIETAKGDEAITFILETLRSKASGAQK